MNKRIVALLFGAMAVMVVAVWLFVDIGRNDDFHLRVYSEATVVGDKHGEYATEDGRIVHAFSNPKGVFDTDESGKLIYVKQSYMIPGTIIAAKEPEWVTFRSLQSNVVLSLPNGPEAKELSVPWEKAATYVQIWITLTLEKEDLALLPAGSDRPNEIAYCVNRLEDRVLEVELYYGNGNTSKKYYSIDPGEKGEFGLDYIILSEDQ